MVDYGAGDPENVQLSDFLGLCLRAFTAFTPFRASRAYTAFGAYGQGFSVWA